MYIETETMPYSFGTKFLLKTPKPAIQAQFKIRKLKPAIIPEDNSTGKLPLCTRELFDCSSRAKPTPIPINMLNTGPAKHAVIAMLDKPFFAMAMLVE